jgi:hypothetical protein
MANGSVCWYAQKPEQEAYHPCQAIANALIGQPFFCSELSEWMMGD